MSLENEIGVPCWFSLMTKNCDAATEFYRQLFDYKIEEFDMPNVGKASMYSAHGATFANPVPLDANFEAPSHWISYFAVADVDAATEQAEKLGGKICYAPFDMPGIGRSSIVTDPSGAVFHLFTPAQDHEKINVMGEQSGQVSWLELIVKDTTSVLPFYSELLSWSAKPADIEGMNYILCSAGDKEIAGIMEQLPDMPDAPATWVPYFNVDAITSASKKAVELGAVPLMEPQAIPNVGTVQLLQDPTGALFNLFEAEKA